MADAHEPIRQNMQQEAEQELVQRKRQGAFAIAMGTVSPAKGDFFVEKVEVSLLSPRIVELGSASA